MASEHALREFGVGSSPVPEVRGRLILPPLSEWNRVSNRQVPEKGQVVFGLVAIDEEWQYTTVWWTGMDFRIGSQMVVDCDAWLVVPEVSQDVAGCR